MTGLRVWLVGLLCWLAAASAVWAEPGEKRVALVVGNGAYRYVPALRNAPFDAADMTAKFKALGFEVFGGADLDRVALIKALVAFGRAAERADVAAVFYAGHGVQVNGQNYLVPVDAQVEYEAELDVSLVPLELAMQQLRRGSRINIVMLDACRDNPFAANLSRTMGTRAVGALGRGLSRVPAVSGTFVAYATQPDNVALDGEGRNSPFTTALLKHIEKPGLSISDLMIEVRNEVMQATNGKQVPWDSSSLTGRFTFKIEGTGIITPPPTNTSEEMLFWQSVKDSRTAGEIEAYLKRYPSGVFADLARARLAELAHPPPPAGEQQSNRGEGATPSQTIVTVPLAPNAWMRVGPQTGQIRGSDQGLALIGGAWTNGRLINGRQDGITARSNDVFDFSNGGDVYVSFRPNGAGKYMSFTPRLISGVSVPYMSTHNSWAGSVVVSDRMPLFAHLRVQPDGGYRLVVTSGDYDLRGGSVLLESAGKLAKLSAPLELFFGDNYASERAGLLVTEARVQLDRASAAGSTSLGNAPGYWTCSGDKWVSVGDPQHAMPSKSCGSQLEIPGTQPACEQAGGRWAPAGIFPRSICRMPTHDGGKSCADDGECEGSCLAELTPAQQDLARQWISLRQKQQLLGKCTPSVPVFGCMAIVREGFVTGMMCRD